MNPLNERGNTAVMALVLLAISSAIFAGSLGYQENLRHSMMTTRLRSHMTSVEEKWKILLSQPSAYSDCNTSTVEVSGSASSKIEEMKKGVQCRLNMTLLDRYKSLPVRGPDCSDEKPCSIDVSLNNADWTKREINFEITMKGKIGERISAKSVTVKIPDDILQNLEFDCIHRTGGVSPAFVGFSAKTGAPICRRIRTNCTDLNKQYMIGILPDTGDVVCADFPNPGEIGCPPSHYLETFEWAGGNNINHACTPRKNPWDIF